MARTQINPVAVNHFALTTNILFTPCDATNGNYVFNDGATLLRFTSTSGSVQTVTVLLPNGVDVNLTVTPRTYSVPANGGGDTGFFPVALYGTSLLFTASSNLVSVLAETFA